MILDETMNEPDTNLSCVGPQLALMNIWNNYYPDGQNENLPFLLFDDDDGEDEDMNDEEGFNDIDDDFDDEDDFDDDFDDDEDDFDEEEDDFDYEEDVDYDDFDE